MDDNVVHSKKPQKQVSKKRNTQYSSTKVKARNLLTNIAYRRYKADDFKNMNFIVDLLTFTLQYFNPIDIARKVDNEDDQKMISFIWEECLPHDFAVEIYKKENYVIVADPKLTYNKANTIVKKWIMERKNKAEVCEKIEDTFKYIHYVFSSLFSKVYSRLSQFGIKNKADFEAVFALYKMKQKTSEHLRFIFQTKAAPVQRKDFHPEEQKPIPVTPIVTEVNTEPKLPTQKRKREKIIYSPEKYKQQKLDLQEALKRNTEKLNAIKKARKSYQ